MITQENIDDLVKIKEIQESVKTSKNTSLIQLIDTFDLKKDVLVDIYNRLVEIAAQRRFLNKLISKYDSTELYTEIMLALHLIYEQEKILDRILHGNLSTQSLKPTDLLNQQQRNSMNHFNALVAAAAKRLEFNPKKETLEKDVKFLKKKFVSLPEQGVHCDIVADRYCNVVSELETRIEESI